MRTVAILGAGDLAGALARTLAEGDAVSRILLVDEARGVAAGKALDIRQAGPIEAYDTAVEGTDDVERLAGADVVVLADVHAGGEWRGEDALQLLPRLATLAPSAPLVFAGAGHHELMSAAVGELHLPASRLVGSAPVAAAASARALAAPAVDASPVDVAIPILGLPPAWVLAWGQASVGGAPLDHMPPHAAARIEQLVTAGWPPGPYALASAAAAVIRAALDRSRRRFCCFAATPFDGVRPVVFAMPVTLCPAGVASVRLPELTPRQRVALESTVLARR
jgi:malate dehydrogenase